MLARIGVYRVLAAGLATWAIAGASSAQAAFTPVLSFTESTGSNAFNQNQSVGWQFNVLAPVTVGGLSWFDEGANGLAVAHSVGIWDPSGTLLASVVIPAGTGASLVGQFRTIDLVIPVTLAPGNGYIVGGENFSTNTERLADDVTQTVDSRIGYVDATFSNIGSGFTRPTQFSTATTGFYGPSFTVGPAVTAVPAPPGVVLALLGGLTIYGGRLVRRGRARAV